MPRPRRLFPPEYKADVVELIRTTGKTVGQVAQELDLTETAVREWSSAPTWMPAGAATLCIGRPLLNLCGHPIHGGWLPGPMIAST
jgi:hypothetical protein